MPFTTLGDVYEVDFIVSRKLRNTWMDDSAGRHYVVATSEQSAVATVQSYMGQGGSLNVKCQGGVKKLLANVIVAV